MSDEAGYYAAVQARRPKTTVAEILKAKKLRRIYAAYHSLFFENGKLKPDAATVLADLVAVARMGEMSSALSDQELRELFGRHKMVLHLINRLDRDGTKRDQLTQAIRESGHE